MNSSENTLLERRYAVLGRYAPLFYDEPLSLVRGEGVWVYDAQGKRYLDVYNNVPHVGHCHPRVVEAISKQAALLNTHTRYLHEFVISYAERLTKTFDPDLSMAVFTCTGSEANELALRIARYCTGGAGVIVTDNAYHGNTAAVAELGTAFMPEARTTTRVRAIPAPDSYRTLHDLTGDALADAYVEEVKRAIAGFSDAGIPLAGIVLCPDFANEGLLAPPHGFLERAVALVREAGGLFIADEVQSGFGRTGQHMWSHQGFDVVPDIATMGKPMGNGHPIAGLVARPDLIERFGAHAMYFNTFGGNPVSCAAALAVLDILEQEDLLRNAVDVGTYAHSRLIELKEKYSLIGDVRCLGMFFALDLVTDRASKEPATEAAGRIVNDMKDRGVLIGRIGRRHSILKMRPAMVFSKGNVDFLVSALDASFRAL